MQKKATGIALLVIGVVFIAVGSSGARMLLLGVGVALVIVGLISVVRQRGAPGSK